MKQKTWKKIVQWVQHKTFRIKETIQSFYFFSFLGFPRSYLFNIILYSVLNKTKTSTCLCVNPPRSQHLTSPLCSPVTMCCCIFRWLKVKKTSSCRELVTEKNVHFFIHFYHQLGKGDKWFFSFHAFEFRMQ